MRSDTWYPADVETVSMNYEELDRVGVIERVIEKRLTQREAVRVLEANARPSTRPPVAS